MMLTCSKCVDNDDGFCDRYGKIVNDDDTCQPVIRVRCSWCGKSTVVRYLESAKSKGTDYKFFCPTCKQERYLREEDIDNG